MRNTAWYGLYRVGRFNVEELSTKRISVLMNGVFVTHKQGKTVGRTRTCDPPDKLCHSTVYATCQIFSEYDSHYTTTAFFSCWSDRMFGKYKDCVEQ
jgi:hypothetical protein